MSNPNMTARVRETLNALASIRCAAAQMEADLLLSIDNADGAPLSTVRFSIKSDGYLYIGSGTASTRVSNDDAVKLRDFLNRWFPAETPQ